LIESPQVQANNISKMLTGVLGAERFPVDVEQLALEYSRMRFPQSYVASVEKMDLPGAEGSLTSNADGSRWTIGYSAALSSPGRIRFAIAHEFGHFMLHRAQQASFACTERDIYERDVSARKLESEADTFASYLLMPLDDFRAQLKGRPMGPAFLEHCRLRYGVPRVAVALKWIEIAPQRAFVVAARDGVLLWARANDAATASGLSLATNESKVPVPARSLLADVARGLAGGTRESDARIWFPRERAGKTVEETAISVDGPDPYVLAVLQMPAIERTWRDDAAEDQRPVRYGKF
jgi:hypothetical protein